jgi:hypothetical protein
MLDSSTDGLTEGDTLIGKKQAIGPWIQISTLTRMFMSEVYLSLLLFLTSSYRMPQENWEKCTFSLKQK